LVKELFNKIKNLHQHDLHQHENSNSVVQETDYSQAQSHLQLKRKEHGISTDPIEVFVKRIENMDQSEDFLESAYYQLIRKFDNRYGI
jgi:hypothetical protein